MYTLNCRGKIIVFEKPAVMGIINCTPDSFFEGHLGLNKDQILAKVSQMLTDGADMIDIGGQSTRPGSIRVGSEEEMERVIPVITAIAERFPEAVLSVDTYHARVAKAAIEAGASIVNDISGGDLDPEMIPTVAGLGCPFICMHMKGTPETMQDHPVYEDLIVTLTGFFEKKIDECKHAGIQDLVLDPGFGFGKTISDNFILLKKLRSLKQFDKPLLAGLSRKSTIYKTLGIDASEALNGTTVLNTIALMNGADILRVHDVKEAKQAVILFEATC